MIYNYTQDSFPNGLCCEALEADILAHGFAAELQEIAIDGGTRSGNMRTGTYTCTIRFDADITQSELDAIIVAYIPAVGGLDGLKRKKYLEIDTKTDELMALGFTHAGRQFSLSIPSQINWTNIGINPNLLTYPYGISVLDDSEVYSFADAAEITAAYYEAVSRKEYLIQSGRDLKSQVLAASSQAEIDAVVDART